VADAPAPPPPPVAIRITRPYATEDEYLERELDTLTRASVTLLGAQSRPQGVVLRFELVLASGQVLMRGEGRVVGFKANAFEGLGGLTLRFTRLDTKSKLLVDKAAALRERRRPSTRPHVSEPMDASSVAPRPSAVPSPPVPQDPPPSFLAAADTSSPFAPAPSAAELPAPVSSRPSRTPDVPTGTAPVVSDAPPAAAGAAAPGTADAPPERDTLLERLRARAKALDMGDVQRILATRRGG
jgi:hypothetical protein